MNTRKFGLIGLVAFVVMAFSVQAGPVWESFKVASWHPWEATKFVWNQGPSAMLEQIRSTRSAEEIITANRAPIPVLVHGEGTVAVTITNNSNKVSEFVMVFKEGSTNALPKMATLQGGTNLVLRELHLIRGEWQ